jgi:DNA-binding transcriptional ArsR family regulator
MEMAEVVMNPIRQRIFQYLLVHDTGTVKEIRTALPDVPSASVYRHMKILTDHGVLVVVGENRIRGTVENIYKLNADALKVCDENGRIVQSALLGLCGAFAKYFAGENPEPIKDMLLFTNCTLTLTDEEFGNFLSEVNTIAAKYMSVGVSAESKTRQITLISSPVDL